MGRTGAHGCGVRDSLPADQQSSYGILVGNYGEAGAIENLGACLSPAYPHQPDQPFLSPDISRVPPSTLIIVGWSQEDVDT